MYCVFVDDSMVTSFASDMLAVSYHTV